MELTVINKQILMLIFAVLVVSVPNVSSAKKISSRTCSKISDEINKDLPKQYNKFNTLTATFCNKYEGVSFHYLYNTTFEYVEKSEENRMKNAFCSNNQTRKLLGLVDAVVLHYFSPSGNEIANITIKERMC